MPGNECGTVPSKPTSSTATTRPRDSAQPLPRTWSCAAATPATRATALRARAPPSIPVPGGSSTSICGVRPRSSPFKALWKPEITDSARISAITPSAMPHPATADRKLANASRRVLLR